MSTTHFQVDERFRGPPNSGNGGYVCGRIAGALAGSAVVRLKAAPPLNTLLTLESSWSEARLLDGATVIGEGRSASLDLAVGPCPPPDAVLASTAAFAGFTAHPFPGCFVCGPGRPAHDGLRIFPGPIPGTPLIAAPWVPDPTLADDAGTVRPEFLWAALDCPGGFAVYPLTAGTAVVLGELCASLTGTVRAGERCTVTGWPIDTQGRKRMAGTAVYGERGDLVARARAVWIEVPAAAWNAS